MDIKGRKELIKEYINFFKSKNHREVPNASLIPVNDPTVLFTTAGMHPLVPFILGQPHPFGKRLCNVQRCVRTGDIEKVGDEVHHTFFEMLGNWSLGDYFKKESIEYSFEFLTKILKIPIKKIAVSCFAGDENAPKDEESAKIWRGIGISDKKIVFLPKENNWWGPAGETGPCGPDTEIFYYSGKNTPDQFNPEDQKWIEIWNNVFMQYEKTKDDKYVELNQKNVDTGMGVERILTALNELEDGYLTECFLPIIKKIEEISGKKYEDNKRCMRIIADHLKASIFIVYDGVIPSNIGRGYVLRRLIRRAIRYGREIGLKKFMKETAGSVFSIYSDYPNFEKNRESIIQEIEKEEEKFLNTLEKGMKEFEKIVKNKKIISGTEAFLLYQSYGFPIEMTEELAKEKNIRVDMNGFEEERKKHQQLSKTASSGVFKSGLADNSEVTTKLHTATHLLNEALRQIINKNIKQKGSNITPERLRFDFNFDRKLTTEEIKKIEEWVNDKIKKSLTVIMEEMSPKEAEKKGAQAEFNIKYPEKVSVYIIKDKDKIVSLEICTGPHVKNTKELGEFKIIKEESVAAGIRRIKAILK